MLRIICQHRTRNIVIISHSTCREWHQAEKLDTATKIRKMSKAFNNFLWAAMTFIIDNQTRLGKIEEAKTMRSDLDIWNFAACVQWGLVYWKCNTCNSFQWYIVTSGTRDITPAHSSRALFADWGKTYKLCAFWRNPLRERGDLCNKEKLLGRKYSTYLLFLNTFSSGNVTYTDNKSPEPSESEVIDMCSTNNLLLFFFVWLSPPLRCVLHILRNKSHEAQGGVAPCYEAWLYKDSTICPGQKWELSFYTRPNHPNYPRLWTFFVEI